MGNGEMVELLGLAVRLVHAEEAHREALRTRYDTSGLKGAEISRRQMAAYADREMIYDRMRRIVLGGNA